jgi:hypothetical protein
MDVVVALPVIAVAGAAIATLAVAAQAARATFGNENLLAVARDLFPDVRVEGTTMIVTAPDGAAVRFSPDATRFRVGPASPQPLARTAEMTGRIVQAYAQKVIEQKAAQSDMQIVGRETAADGTVRLRVRRQAAPGGRSAEIVADVGAEGLVRLETQHVKGPACSRLLDEFASALGPPRVREKTPEYFEADVELEDEPEREHN